MATSKDARSLQLKGVKEKRVKDNEAAAKKAAEDAARKAAELKKAEADAKAKREAEWKKSEAYKQTREYKAAQRAKLDVPDVGRVEKDVRQALRRLHKDYLRHPAWKDVVKCANDLIEKITDLDAVHRAARTRDRRQPRININLLSHPKLIVAYKALGGDEPVSAETPHADLRSMIYDLVVGLGFSQQQLWMVLDVKGNLTELGEKRLKEQRSKRR